MKITHQLSQLERNLIVQALHELNSIIWEKEKEALQNMLMNAPTVTLVLEK
jgi:hypothetical protein